MFDAAYIDSSYEVAVWSACAVSQASPLFEQALADRRRVLGYHHDTLTRMNNPAIVKRQLEEVQS
jgi:hypothetical protein